MDGQGGGYGTGLGVQPPRLVQRCVGQRTPEKRGDRLRALRSIANELHGNLHGNYYKREFLLNAESIGLDLDSMAELLEILDPLRGTVGQ